MTLSHTSVAVAMAMATLALNGCTSNPAPAPAPRVGGSSPSSPTSPTAPEPSPRRHRPHVVVRTLDWHLPYAIAREAAIRRGGHVVLAGGLLPGDRSTDQVVSVDLRTGRKRVRAPLAEPVHDTAGAFLGNRLLVIGGGNSAEQDDVQASRYPPGPWSHLAPLPQPRSDLSAVLLGAHVIVLGGYDGHTPAVPSVLSSADGARWRRLGRLPIPVRYAAAVAGERWVYVFGGELDGVMQRTVQRIDGDGNSSVIGRLPVALGHAAAVRFGDRILVAGGRLSATVVTDRMWWFDPATGHFTPAGHLPTPLADTAVVAGARTAYLLGGEDPKETDRVVSIRGRGLDLRTPLP